VEDHDYRCSIGSVIYIGGVQKVIVTYSKCPSPSLVKRYELRYEYKGILDERIFFGNISVLFGI